MSILFTLFHIFEIQNDLKSLCPLLHPLLSLSLEAPKPTHRTVFLFYPQPNLSSFPPKLPPQLCLLRAQHNRGSPNWSSQKPGRDSIWPSHPVINPFLFTTKTCVPSVHFFPLTVTPLKWKPSISLTRTHQASPNRAPYVHLTGLKTNGSCHSRAFKPFLVNPTVLRINSKLSPGRASLLLWLRACHHAPPQAVSSPISHFVHSFSVICFRLSPLLSHLPGMLFPPPPLSAICYASFTSQL